MKILEGIEQGVVTRLVVNAIYNSYKKLVGRSKKNDDKKEPTHHREELVTRNDLKNLLEAVCFVICIVSLSYSCFTLLAGKQDNRLVHSGTSLVFSMAVLARTPSRKCKNQQ